VGKEFSKTLRKYQQQKSGVIYKEIKIMKPRWQQKLSQLLIAILLAIGGIFIFNTLRVLGQLTPDKTLGAENSVVEQDKLDAAKDIINGGAARGSNLFHSFEKFNVGENRSVYFANPTGIDNILTRVTGKDISNILGTLGVNGTANLFLINPNGIVFGKNAVLDIKGSFTATTADEIKLGEDEFFSATNPESSNLLTVQPGALFRNALRNQQAEIRNEGNLQVGQNLTFDADNINLSGILQAGDNLNLLANNTLRIRDSFTQPFIASAGGNLLVQGNQSVDIFALNNSNSGLFSGGDMVLRSANTVGGDAHYWSGGNFKIEQLNGSLGNLNSPHDPIIKANGDVSLQAYEGASLHIWATGKVDIPYYVWIQGADTINGLTETITLSDGTSRNINSKSEPTLDIRAGLTLAGLGTPTTITTGGTAYGLDTYLPSSSADINIGTVLFVNSAFTTILPGKVLLTNEYQPNSSLTGNITVTDTIGYGAILMGGNTGTRSVNLDSKDGITLNGNVGVSSPNGIGGNITLLANNNILTRSINASGGGNGGSGNINMTSKNGEITLNKTSILNNNSGVIKGGDINITGRSIFVTNGSIIAATNLGKGDTGSIKITATNAVKFDGKSFAESAVGRGAVGTSGGIEIATKSLELFGASYLSAGTFGQGNAGNIKITATDFVTFDGQSVAQNAVASGAIGKAGDMEIFTQSLELLGGSYLTASTSGQGNAGTIKITATDSIKLDGDSSVGSTVQTGGIGTSGSLEIFTQSLELLDGSYLTVSTRGRGDAGNIKITATESIKLDGDSSVGNTVASGGIGKAGDVDISTKSLELLGGSLLTVSTSGTGDAGNVKITATDFVKFNNQSVAESVVGKGGVGTAGGVDISTKSLELLGGSRLDTATFGEGDAGNVKIIATDYIKIDGQSVAQSAVGRGAVGIAGGVDISSKSLELLGGSIITASTIGEGDAGAVKIIATDTIRFDGESSAQSTVQPEAVGKAGGIDISSNSLEMLGGSYVSASTFGQGDANTVRITATDAIKFDGYSFVASAVGRGAVGIAGGVDIFSQSLEILGGSYITASTLSKGDAGTIKITATDTIRFDSGFAQSIVAPGAVGKAGGVDISSKSLELLGGSIISASTFGEGDAGTVKITANDFLKFDHQSAAQSTVGRGAVGKAGGINIYSQSLEILSDSYITASTYGQGNAGSVNITANTFTATTGGRVLTTTSGSAQAGNINLEVRDNITLDGTNTGLFANTEIGSTGNSGSITIDPQIFIIRNGAGIGVNSQGSGEGGDISVQAGLLSLNNQAFISAETASNQGGNINLAINDLLLLRNNSRISATAGTAQGGGNGGDITINAPFIVAFPQENSDITANAFEGNGGNINITTNALFGIEFRPQETQRSDITASSQFGIAGNVQINRPDVDPTSGLLELPGNLVDAESLNKDVCAIKDNKIAGGSSFIITGKGGLPADTDELISHSPAYLEWENNPETVTESKPADVKVSQEKKNDVPEIQEAQGWMMTTDGRVILTANAPKVTLQSSGVNFSGCK
jgi:filamentous hemagglutinin family protein